MRKRNKFSLSHYQLTTIKMGGLYPVGWFPVLPGDTVQQATSVFLRVTPMVAPVMHPCHVILHHWFVPNRLIWDDWEKFITGGEDGLDASVHPFINLGPGQSAGPAGSLADHLGVPIDKIATDANVKINALPFRAYDLIWNEWYRQESITEPTPLITTSGNDATSNTYVLPKAWQKDYFTTALPWPQKGAPITIPVDAGQANVTIKDDGPFVLYAQMQKDQHFKFTHTNTYAFHATTPETSGMPACPGEKRIDGTAEIYQGEPLGACSPDGTDKLFGKTTNLGYLQGLRGEVNASLGQIQIDKLREALALQRFEEHRAMYGSRYTEYLRYLGVRSSDARLQRPEFLGGSRRTIQFSEVLQTGPGDTPVGTMRGHGATALRTNRYRRFFEEHGIVMTLMSVMPIPIYEQGLSRHWSRETKEDYWQKELQHIGEQGIKQKELFISSPTPDHVFGYTDRYNEYRSQSSYVTGEFHDLLNYWHFAREFQNDPSLNTDFIYGSPTDRPFAEKTKDSLYCMINHSIQARRLVDRDGTPRV